MADSTPAKEDTSVPPAKTEAPPVAAEHETQTPSTAPTPPSAAPPPHADPRVTQLTALFPDTDPSIIEAVLQHEGTVESSTDVLLAMSDPSYKPSQMDTDEQLARELEAQDRAQAVQLQQQRQSQPPQPVPITYQAYTPRRRAGTGGAAGGIGASPSSPSTQATYQPGEQPKDELDQLSENFSKLAEQGKKTLTNLFGKVKEQINKVDVGGSSGAGTSASGSQPLPALPQPQSSSQTQGGWEAPTTLPRPASSSRQPQPTPKPQLIPDKATPPIPSEEVTSKAPALKTASTSSEAPPAGTSDEPKKDFSKLGFLPKQSISLLDGKDKDHAKKADDDDEDDEEDLEYVKSPFDDD